MWWCLPFLSLKKHNFGKPVPHHCFYDKEREWYFLQIYLKQFQWTKQAPLGDRRLYPPHKGI